MLTVYPVCKTTTMRTTLFIQHLSSISNEAQGAQEEQAKEEKNRMKPAGIT